MLALGFIVGGTLVMELVFSYPGVGGYMFEAVGTRDYPAIQGAFLAVLGALAGAGKWLKDWKMDDLPPPPRPHLLQRPNRSG